VGERRGRRLVRPDRRLLPPPRAGVIIRGVRNPSDLRHEYQLAAMNEALGITTLLLPAQPGLSGVSSTLVRAGRS
jgi:pantetheine-phosphate adenylyltransferase